MNLNFNKWLAEEDYRGDHTSPDRDTGSPLHDLTNTYPEDIYGPNGAQYYGSGDLPMDNVSVSVMRMSRGKPNMQIRIYRAIPAVITVQDKISDLEQQKRYILKYGRVPSHVSTNKSSSAYYEIISDELDKLRLNNIQEEKIKINVGDWVTICRAYAVEHGKTLGRYKIITKVVPARTLYNNGDSLHEWGYWP